MTRIILATFCICIAFINISVFAAASDCQNIENMTAQEVLELCKPDSGP